MSFLKMSHKGAHAHHTENTLEAFEEAYKQGIHAFETDIRLTKDGKAVLFHDPLLKRILKDKRKLSQITLAEFKSLSKPNRTLLSLYDYLSIFSKKDVYFNLELKEDAIDETLSLIKKFHLENRMVVSSFQSKILLKLKQSAPHIKRGKLTLHGIGSIQEALHVGASHLIVHNKMLLAKIFILKAHKKGLFVWTWPINHKKRLEQLISWNIDGVMTDHPEVFREEDVNEE